MKQLVNTLFLPLCRYLLYSSDKGIDIFEENTIDNLLSMDSSLPTEHNLSWTKDFLSSLNLTEN